MADYIVKDTELTQIADAIRAKGSTSASLVFPSGFASAIEEIKGGTIGGDVTVIDKTINVVGTDPVTFEQYLNGTLTTATHSTCSFIRTNAFYNFVQLSTVAFPECQTIGMSAFAGCISLSDIMFPKCTTISRYAFSGCYGLTTIYFSLVTQVGNSAFTECTNLTDVALPLATNVSGAFAWCYKLSNVSLPNATNISGAFQYCYSLSSIVLPTVESINYATFYYCSRLLSVYLPGSSVVQLTASPTATYGSPFGNTPIMGFTNYTSGQYGSIYVPKSLVSAYKQSTNWVAIADRIAAIS